MPDPRPDLRGPPPPRYRVVERNRRLVVIDSLGDTPVSRPASRIPLPLRLDRTRFDGSAKLTTHALYDARGPRTLSLDADRAALVGRVRVAAVAAAIITVLVVLAAPGLFLIPVFGLSSGKVRERLRGAITGWLDRMERGPG